MSTRIGFIGLGIMGGPMADNLVKAGFEVTGYNRSPARVEQLVAAGGQGAKDIAGTVADADVVATMLPDSPDVRAVLAGDRSDPGAAAGPFLEDIRRVASVVEHAYIAARNGATVAISDDA